MSATMTVPAPTVTTAVCGVEDLSPGIGQTFEIGGLRVSLFRTREGMIYATDAACPHAGAPLGDGIVAGACVACPYHARRFDLATGRCDEAGTPAVRTYPVSVHGDRVSVAVPA